MSAQSSLLMHADYIRADPAVTPCGFRFQSVAHAMRPAIPHNQPSMIPQLQASRGTEGARRQVTMAPFPPASLRSDTFYHASESRHSRTIKQAEDVDIEDKSLAIAERTQSTSSQ